MRRHEQVPKDLTVSKKLKQNKGLTYKVFAEEIVFWKPDLHPENGIVIIYQKYIWFKTKYTVSYIQYICSLEYSTCVFLLTFLPNYTVGFFKLISHPGSHWFPFLPLCLDRQLADIGSLAWYRWSIMVSTTSPLVSVTSAKEPTSKHLIYILLTHHDVSDVVSNQTGCVSSQQTVITWIRMTIPTHNYSGAIPKWNRYVNMIFRRNQKRLSNTKCTQWQHLKGNMWLLLSAFIMNRVSNK